MKILPKGTGWYPAEICTEDLKLLNLILAKFVGAGFAFHAFTKIVIITYHSCIPSEFSVLLPVAFY